MQRLCEADARLAVGPLGHVALGQCQGFGGAAELQGVVEGVAECGLRQLGHAFGMQGCGAGDERRGFGGLAAFAQ